MRDRGSARSPSMTEERRRRGWLSPCNWASSEHSEIPVADRGLDRVPTEQSRHTVAYIDPMSPSPMGMSGTCCIFDLDEHL